MHTHPSQASSSRIAVVLLALWLFPSIAFGEPAEAPGLPAPQPFLLGGIQTHELDHERWMAALHRQGMNAVQVTVYAQQGPWNTAKLWYAEEEPAVLSEIRAARRNGLQVVLILRVALDHGAPENRHLWHGLVYPETEAETREWFRLYGDFVVKWAKIAQREGVEVLGIASEMNALAATLPVDEVPGLAQWYLDPESQQRLRDLVGRSEHLFTEDIRMGMGAGDFESLDEFLVQRNRAEQAWARVYTFADAEDRPAAMNQRRRLLDSLWRGLAKRVRDVYNGRLTLAANFDNFHEVGFWDVLDLMGVNAYFPLRETLETPVEGTRLADAWRGVLGGISTFKQEQSLDLPVVFTELGYTRWRGVTVAPWSSQGFIPMWDPDGDTDKDRAFFWAVQPLAPQERALALGALHRVWRESPEQLAGVLYWKLSSDSDLERYEPFMLYLGDDLGDPALPELRRFAEGIRPLDPAGEGPYGRATEAILRGDTETLKAVPTEAVRPTAPSQATGLTEDRQDLLSLAVRLGHREIVVHLLDQGAAKDVPDSHGLLPLHWTCFQDDPDLVELLRPETASPRRDGLDETPLMKCARLDNVAVARRLIEGGGRVDARNRHGRSALHLAADQGSAAMVELLLARGGDAAAADEHGMSPLHLGARRGRPEIVSALARGGKGATNPEGNRPASEAATFGRRDVFRTLFDPAVVRERNAYGQSLLHLAAHGGDAEILRVLLPHFPEVDLTDDDGWTPLAFATRNGQLDAVDLLLTKGAKADRQNGKGSSPLHLAAASREPRLIQRLLKTEVDVDLKDGEGNTPLHHA
ncbi:MAG: ankyrin repeat domain-containing protein, partial [Acidobacteriota bacterium]